MNRSLLVVAGLLWCGAIARADAATPLMVPEVVADSSAVWAGLQSGQMSVFQAWRDGLLDAATVQAGLAKGVAGGQDEKAMQLRRELGELLVRNAPGDMADVAKLPAGVQLALPAVADAALLQAQASGNNGRVRISLLLRLDTRSARRQAMVEAVRLMRAQPTSPAGVQEVCRVFKAQDLDLSRANAYLALVKSGQGENPLLTFFDEAAPAAAPAPVAE